MLFIKPKLVLTKWSECRLLNHHFKKPSIWCAHLVCYSQQGSPCTNEHETTVPKQNRKTSKRRIPTQAQSHPSAYEFPELHFPPDSTEPGPLRSSEAPRIWSTNCGPPGTRGFHSATWVISGGWGHHSFQKPRCQANRKITGILNQVFRLWSSFFLESFLLKKKKKDGVKLLYLCQVTTKGQVCKINCVAFLPAAHLPHMSFITQWKTIKCTVVLPSGIMHLTALFV